MRKGQKEFSVRTILAAYKKTGFCPTSGKFCKGSDCCPIFTFAYVNGFRLSAKEKLHNDGGRALEFTMKLLGVDWPTLWAFIDGFDSNYSQDISKKTRRYRFNKLGKKMKDLLSPATV